MHSGHRIRLFRVFYIQGFHSLKNETQIPIKVRLIFAGALTFYRRAFAVTGPNSEMKDIRRNMAAVFLALERYEEALEEAKKSMESDKSQKQEKSMLR